MRKNLRLKATLTALAIAFALLVTVLSAMNVEAAGTKSKVAMNKAKVTVCTGKSYTLKMTGISKKVKWSASDKSVVSIKASGKNKKDCKISAKKKGTATITAKVGKKKYKATVKVAGHKYGKVTYKWNSDNSKCTASKKCSRCGKTLKQTVKTSKKVTQKGSCTKAEKTTYTAKFTKYSFGTKTKKVTQKAAHVWGEPTYYWQETKSGDIGCYARIECQKCGDATSEAATVTRITDNEGHIHYIATFKNPECKTQTKEGAYLDKTNISIRSDRPATVTLTNGTIQKFKLDALPEHGYEPELSEIYDLGVVGTISADKKSIVISTTNRAAENNGLKATITTTEGEQLPISIDIEFTPGEYDFGAVNHCYSDWNYTYDEDGNNTGTVFTAFYPYGKYRGIYKFYRNNQGISSVVPATGTDYVMDCNTRSDYDVAYNFYNHQVRRDGTECTLDQKAQEIERECGERADYKSKARIEWDGLAREIQINTYDDNFYNYVREKYGDTGMKYLDSVGSGFGENVTSNAQLKKIVDDWTAVSGEKPSWYYNEDGSIYYTAFSDWAEWSGRDIGLCSYTGYNESTDSFYQYYPPALPDNFRE